MAAENLTQQLLELLKIDSVTGNEKEISAYIEKQLQSLTSFNLDKDNLALFYSSAFNPLKKTIAFYGHLDTVNNQQDEPPYVKNNLIYGCGASDMKGGLAVMMELMRLIDQQKEVQYNVFFIFYDKEEGPFEENGLKNLLLKFPQLVQSDLAFVLEPTNNAIQMGCVGVINAQLIFRGKSAHSARPWEGQNAIQESWPLLKKLYNFQPQKVEYNQLVFYEVINATTANGGKAKNIIPDLFMLHLNYRFAPGKSLEHATKELYQWIGTVPEIQILDAAPAGEVVLENKILDFFQTQNHLKYEAKQAWTDIARLAQCGISAVNFGPGDPDEAHQKNEKISEPALIKSYHLLKELILS